MPAQELTKRELAVLELIAEGYTRWRIAEVLGLSEGMVRAVIRDLCQRYDCPMRDLPDAVRDAHETLATD